jgi:hypothetical protein
MAIKSYSSSNVNIFLKIQWKHKKHHPANTDVIAGSGVNSVGDSPGVPPNKWGNPA